MKCLLMDDTPPHSRRLAWLDACRGLAAAAVMAFHFQGHRINTRLWQELPLDFSRILRYGELGVQVFFVISGFVMAHCLRDQPIDGAVMRNFFRRRFFRLTPLYWTAILIAVITAYTSRHLWGNSDVQLPTIPQVLAHLVYLQGILGYRDIHPIFWTLCHEVQFYIAFIGLLVLGQALSKRKRRTNVVGHVTAPWVLILFGISGILSGTGAWKASGWCLDTWYLFSLGVLTYAVASHRLSIGWLILYATSLALWNVDTEKVEPLQKLTGLATSALFLLASVAGTLDRLGQLASLQFLGRISYGLYLFHGIVGYRVLSVGHHFTGTQPLWAVFWWLIACSTSFLTAWILHVTIERPCMNLPIRQTPSRLAI